MHFKVSDEDYGADDIVGEGTCSLADLCQEGGSDCSYEIKHNGSGAGTVHFITSWVDFSKAKAEMDSDRLRQEEEERVRLAEEAAIAAAAAAEAEAAEQERLRLEAEEAERIAKEAA